MRLVDTVDEQLALEEIIEASKPPIPMGARGAHYLIFTPFRYSSPWPSRFRRADAPGLWYGADDAQIVCAEMAYWRWRFLQDSDGLRGDQVITEHTLFKASFAGTELDLTAAPWDALRSSWRDPEDYSACHALADAVRGATPVIDAIRYESARRENGMCAAVFHAGALTIRELNAQQTWICKTTAKTVFFTSKANGGSMAFDF
ncbi:MAG: RES family NAD+ phosphorylase [Thiomonas sp.]|nr:RES family NAD+ phosphorylase [Thiomonas sp.]